ncbi:TetR/AcrR family transcriptional regulator [Pseudochrobactrum algeriensis]|uniref:TetR/AcrR family transcriptional regulator n=1 Tax=Pseudochrobactrum algeriensis TaxID=2834768 RepID=UPI001BCB901D|nr:TetR/AcrR family transcriptional regulator [Pseudochrobactrum algeriensis]QVQ36636.1 TetR/AcrR family transcriptional regulator [Pseudochrobactrum algeriensis]QVQ39851.1 TetR/AcrR family transcriptional regulator [Pseudochrobactrum algeriensis]QVQ43773.1 TetR/AcrR family transcriptional regulator [Pseudochrobactrum algeriensis]
MRKSTELRKAEIVAAVLDLADQIGPDRVTTGAAAAAVGVSQAALFRHFPTKAAMWLAMADHVTGELAIAWQRAMTGTDGPIDRVTALVVAQLGQIAATPALPMLLFSRELNVGNEDLRAAFRGLLMKFQGLIVTELARGQDAGLLRREVAPEDAAVLLTSLVQGMAIRWSFGARNFSLIGEGKRVLEIQLRLLTMKED